MFSILHVLCFILVSVVSRARADLFSAIAQIEPLLETHKGVIRDLADYIQKEDQRLAVLTSYLETYKVEQEHMMKDVSNYLGTPIKAFILIKRLTTDLSDIEDFIELGNENIQNVTLYHSDVNYPTLQDIGGAAEAITRLQTTYRIAAHDLAEGRIQGVKRSTPMTSSDCFELGRVLYKLKDYQNTVAWCIEALRKYDDDAQLLYGEVEILEYISFSYYMMGDVKTALRWIIKLLKLDPNHTRARHNVRIFRKALAQEQSNDTDKTEGKDAQENKNENKIFWSKVKMAGAENFAALCRGEKKVPSEVARRLRCRYMTGSHPFRILSPFKVEQLYIDPDVLLFHDVISDREIEIIKNKATPLLRSANTQESRSGKSVTAAYRISKTAWLDDDLSPVVSRVTRRVADMTGLSITTAEKLQVVNYGIGGHYSPHCDFRIDENLKGISKRHGNRIATVLFYMSNVEQGGATAFTELGLSVFPVKGAALFWHNLLPSGEGDYNTFHGACPVLRGSKWVCTKWLRQGGQELLLPCNSKQQKKASKRMLKTFLFKMKDNLKNLFPTETVVFPSDLKLADNI